jgi:hypothetical protein
MYLNGKTMKTAGTGIFDITRPNLSGGWNIADQSPPSKMA